ncbi:MAG TPA: hypothetical protein VNK52_00780 [Hyphomicrobiaceae bacterium]|nr:hypothetical protein [Hyphomicrobiaceae bacterium]
MELCGHELTIEGRLIRIGRLEAEGFEYVEDPEPLLAEITRAGAGLDLFTFIQKLPGQPPLYRYAMEWDNLAAMPITTFEHWWTRQIDAKTRNMVRRAEKKGISLREVPFDDNLVKGIWEIYNECPVRQRRPFPHFGKDVETVRRMSATFLASSVFIGAFLGEKLVGFAKLTMDRARSQAAVMHILSLVEHRDKAPMNALIAESVRACERRAVPYLVYSKFSYWKKQRDSLSDFKERNGFRRYDIPRYYIPLTHRGRLALNLGLQHGLYGGIPDPLVAMMRQFREAWYRRAGRMGVWIP